MKRTDWPHFKAQELACRCIYQDCPRHGMSEVFMVRLETLRQQFGAPLPVVSGFRCPAHNANVSTTGKDGPHTTGHAADIRVSGAAALRLIMLADGLGFTGYGLMQHGPHDSRFIHLDDLEAPAFPRPALWTY